MQAKFAGLRVKPFAPGVGINLDHVVVVAKRTRASKFPSGLSTALPSIGRHSDLFQDEVQKLALLLAGLAGGRRPRSPVRTLLTRARLTANKAVPRLLLNGLMNRGVSVN